MDEKYEQKVPTSYTNIMERLAWFNIDKINAQFLRDLPDQEEITKNNVFMGGVPTFLGIKCHMNHFIRRNGKEVDEFGKDADKQRLSENTLDDTGSGNGYVKNGKPLRSARTTKYVSRFGSTSISQKVLQTIYSKRLHYT